MAEDREFKFVIQLGFAKAHYKIIPRGKSVGLEEKVWVALGYEAPQNMGVPLQYLHNGWSWEFKFGTELGFCQRPPQNHTQRTSGRGLELENLPYFYNGHAVLLALVELVI